MSCPSARSSPATGSPRAAPRAPHCRRRPRGHRHHRRPARPGFEMRIVDARATDVPAGEAGEVLLRGGSVMARYLDDPEATAKVLSPGVVAHRGPRRDRRVRPPAHRRPVKDMFIVGGFNAYPAEIENILLRHPAISQAAVIGIPDDRLGEVGMAFVVPLRALGRRRDHRLEPRPDGELQGAPGRRDRRRAPAQRHRQGDEGHPARAQPPPQVASHERTASGQPFVPRRPARGRDGGVGRRTLGRLPCWPTGAPTSSRSSRRRAIRCAAPSGPSASAVTTSPTRPSRRTTAASAASSSTCASRRCPGSLEELSRNGGRLPHQPPSRCARRPRPRARGNGRTPPPPRLLQCQRLRPARATTATARPTTSAPSGPVPAYRSSWPSAEGMPLNARGGIGDHITGLAALAGLLAAVLSSARPGAGRVVEVSLSRTGAYVLGWDLGLQMKLGKVAPAEGAAREPVAADELVPDRRTGAGSSSPAWRRSATSGPSAAPSGATTCSTTRASRARRHPEEPGRGHRPARRDHCRKSRSRNGLSASTARACGGRRRRLRPRSWRTPARWPTTASWRSEGGRRCRLGQRTRDLLRCGRSTRRRGTQARGAHRRRARGAAGAPARAAAEYRGRSALTRARAIRPRAMTRRWISLVPSPITMSGASRYSRSTGQLGGVAHAAVDPHRLGGQLERRLAGEELGHAGLDVATQPGHLAFGRVPRRQPRRLSRVAMSASFSWMAWCSAMGLPKVSRSWA